MCKFVDARGLYQSLIAALTITVLHASAAVAAPTPVTTCGQVLSLSGDYELVGNLTCVGTAILINGDNVRFNLAGFFLAGDGTGAGIEVSLVSRVRIRNGTIRHFGNGIRLDTSNNVRVSEMVLVGNGDGIQLHDSNNNRISNSQITTNVIGVRIEGSDQNIVSDNTISNNVADPAVSVSAGVLVQNASTGNAISSNIVSANGSVGVTLQDSDNNLVENNTVSNTTAGGGVPSPGITVIGSSSAKIRGNTVTGNLFGIEIGPGLGTATDNVVVGNTTNGNSQGILVQNGATSNTIRMNTATGNGFVDLNDANSGCDANGWANNTFVTDFVAGLSDGGPGVGCIQ